MIDPAQLPALHADLDRLLDACSHAITGDPAARPRPGQHALSHDLLDSHAARGHLLGQAPTGCGKGLAYGAVAFLLAARLGWRTAVSTESKALQAQLVGKDFPLVAAATGDLFGTTPTFALHQGFANHPCPMAAVAGAVELLRVDDPLVHPGRGRGRGLDEAAQAANVRACWDLADDLEAAAATLPAEVVVDGRTLSGPDVARLLAWALSAAGDEHVASRADVQADDRLWRQVSVQPSECVGTRCPLRRACPAVRSRTVAGEADVVVTNHSLMAVQAATGVKAVVDNQTLGAFDCLVFDECHPLPSIVRQAGERVLDAWRVRGLARQAADLAGVGDFRGHDATRLHRRGLALADQLSAALSGVGTRPVTFDAGNHPLGPLVGDLDEWCADLLRALPKPSQVDDPRGRVRVSRLRGEATDLADELGDAVDPERDLARWVQADRRGDRLVPSVRQSPVDVGGRIAANLFQAQPPESPAEARLRQQMGLPRPDVPPQPLGVAMVSATLPGGFRWQVGLLADQRDYASPFDDAYGSSLLYVPRIVDPAVLALVAGFDGRRWRLDVDMFAEWAATQVVDLVAANRGHALVLAARASDGRAYAAALRRSGLGVRVLSQWDGPGAQQVVDDWRADQSSVLVGTRSMMTGVDASGETLTLVVLDRPSRAPRNPVDDARVQSLVQRSGWDEQAATRAVYVSDAELLMEQAAGRLIRATSDHGLCAVLDPRLMLGTPLSYDEPTRQAYMRAFRRFTHRTGTRQAALDFLVRQATARDLAGVA